MSATVGICFAAGFLYCSAALHNKMCVYWVNDEGLIERKRLVITFVIICCGRRKGGVLQQAFLCFSSKVTTVIRGQATSLCPGPAWKGTTALQERPRPSSTPAPEAPSTQESGHAALLTACYALLDSIVLQWAYQSPQVRCLIPF